MTTKPVNARQKLLHNFSVDYKSDADDRRYVGDFTTKKLAIRDLAALGVRKAQLNGGYHHDSENPGKGVDEQTDEFNAMIAHLELALVKFPQWWNMDEITDVSLIGHIYKEVISFENKFRGSGGVSGGESEGSGPAETPEADTDGSSGPVVDPEVQASLEP